VADVTPRYAFPHQEAGDPPDGATLGQDLAEAVDAALGTVEDGADTRLDALEADVSHLEGRLVGFDDSTSNASATSGTTELIVDTVVASLVSGRRYKIEWVLSFSGSVDNDIFFLLLRAGTTTSDTQLKFNSVEIGNQFAAVLVAYFTAGSTGNQTFIGTARRSSGTGTLTAAGAANNPRYITVERMD
jgi:hypothetical protein